GLDQTSLATSLQLLAQGPDVDVDHVRLAQEVEPPHTLEDQVARQHLARMVQQEFEQLVLARGELQLPLSPSDFTRSAVQLEIGHPQHFGSLRCCSAQQRPNPCHQFVEDKRLGQV